MERCCRELPYSYCRRLSLPQAKIIHDDVLNWKHFPRYWPFVRGIYQSPVNSPQKGQWCRALVFSLICIWINSSVNNREAGDLRRYRARYDVIVMETSVPSVTSLVVKCPTPVGTVLSCVLFRSYRRQSVFDGRALAEWLTCLPPLWVAKVPLGSRDLGFETMHHHMRQFVMFYALVGLYQNHDSV